MSTLPLILILTAFYAWADRFSGGGLGWQKLSHDGGGPLRGRGQFYAALIGAPLFYLLAGPWFAWAAVAWAGARSFQWKLNGLSAMTPEPTALGITSALVRHSYPVIILAAGAVFCALNGFGFPPFNTLIWLAYPVGATLLALRQTNEVKHERDVNPQTELLRGALWGIVLGISYALGA